MNKNDMQQMLASSYLSGSSVGYIDDLYESYLTDPQSVTPEWRAYFASLPAVDGIAETSHAQIRQRFSDLAKAPRVTAVAGQTNTIDTLKHIAIANLVNAYRNYGHYQANLDPLGLTPKPAVPMLDLSYHGLTQADLNMAVPAGALLGLSATNLQELQMALKQTYCGTLGVEYMHTGDPVQIRWFQERLESIRSKPTFSAAAKKQILIKLTQAEGLEKYLGARYVAQKRFSLEGGDSLIPLLQEIIEHGAGLGVKEVAIGMPHRGRLSVLINILGKPAQELFDHFEGKHANTGRSGDVKYHMGHSADVQTPQGVVHLALAFNPSHLEIVSPVVAGSVRSRQQLRQDIQREQVVPIQMHGDAAFAGQGVVMETFALSQARGFYVGGSVHVVVNNQVGFTTSNPQDARSSFYCSDAAKIVAAPILHVNGDDPEAVVFAAQLAINYRQTFKRDIVIDLVCYRRHGHNEADEPAATQPVMYQKIRSMPTTRKIYADKLIQEKVCTEAEANELLEAYRTRLDSGKVVLDSILTIPMVNRWEAYLKPDVDISKIKTSLPLAQLQKMAQRLDSLPKDFKPQAQVGKTLEERRKMTAGDVSMNWGYAELLAYASLVTESYAIRLVGQDSGRGTFSHRHARIYDNQTGEAYVPLQHVADDQANFMVIDSVLSEEAVLAFEYGYAATDPKTLVLWEAQYGDFWNGAEVVVDQFIAAGEQKWGRYAGLVMLLPHGYEGAGPEHTSARPERFLQLCAQRNMQVCMPTTPAQMFHLLRRQMLMPARRPLIVMTPKSLLRHKLAVSTMDELAQNGFQLLIPEVDKIALTQTRKLVLCSGRVYYDLLEQRRAQPAQDVAIVRLEQLYPFPTAELQAELKRYKKTSDIVWCQEEPLNQGAWYQIQDQLRACLAAGQQLVCVTRPEAAAPATGYGDIHQREQTKLVQEALA